MVLPQAETFSVVLNRVTVNNTNNAGTTSVNFTTLDGSPATVYLINTLQPNGSGPAATLTGGGTMTAGGPSDTSTVTVNLATAAPADAVIDLVYGSTGGPVAGTDYVTTGDFFVIPAGLTTAPAITLTGNDGKIGAFTVAIPSNGYLAPHRAPHPVSALS